ncbi:MAG TPA: hypothetical protein VM284_04765 [Candidatus Limnocylindria bacterium]|nr:hypothetical protein [Candidatus Limnocylindria bacterium]
MAAIKDVPLMENTASTDSNRRDMRVVEWLVAGVALLASLLLALPK